MKQLFKIQAVISIFLFTFIFQSQLMAQSAGPDKVIVCANSNMQAVGTGTWTTVPAGASIAPANLTNPTAPVTFPGGYGTYTFTWTPTVGAPDNVTITFHQVSIVSATLNSNCSTASLVGSNPGGTFSGVWTSNNASVIITNSTSPSASASNLPQGVAVTFTWTITAEVCSQNAATALTNSTPTGVDAGGHPVTEDAEVCTNNSYNLSGSAIGVGQTGAWTFQTGSGVFNNSANPSATVSNLVSGINILRWTVSNGTCSAFDDITLYNNTVVATATSPVVCSSTATLNANLPSGATGLWTKDPAGAPTVIVTPTNPGTNVTNLQVGNNTFIWTLTKGTCTDSEWITVTRVNLIADAGADQSNICSSSTNLTANNPAPASGVWTVTSGSGTFGNASLNTTAVTGLSAITPNVFRWTVSMTGCASTVYDEVTILSNAMPVDAGADQLGVCANSITLSAVTGDPSAYGATGVWSTVSSASIVNPSSSVTLVNNLAPATSTFRWTVTKNGCSVWDEMQVTRNQYAISAGTDQTICGTSATLNGSDPGPGGTGNWTIISGTGTLNNANYRYATVSNITGFPLTLRWTVAGTCTGSDDVVIYNQGTTQANIAASTLYANCGTTLYNVLSATNAPKAGETGTWSQINGSGVIFSASTSQTTNVSNLSLPVLPAISRAHQIVYTITDGLCTTKDTVTIYTNSLVAANAGPDQLGLCSQYVNLDANTLPSGAVGTWSGIGAGSTNVWFADPNNPDTKAKTYWNGAWQTRTGYYTFDMRWTVTNGLCTSTDDVRITNAWVASASVQGLNPQERDIYFCGAGTLQLSAFPTSAQNQNGGWFLTQNFGGALNFSGSNSPIGCGPAAFQERITAFDSDATVTGATGDFFLLWVQCNTQCPGGYNYDTLYVHVVVRLDQAASVNAEAPVNPYYTAGGSIKPFAGPDQNICGSTAVLGAANPETDNLAHTSGSWAPVPGVTFADMNSPSTLISGLEAGSYVFTWTVTNECSSIFDQITVNVYGATEIDAGTDQTTCNTFTVFNATAPASGSTGQWTVKSGGGVITSPSAYNSTVTNLLQGRNVFLWTVSSPFCVAIDSVVIYNAQPPKPNAGPDQVFCGTGQMQAVPPVSGTATWSVVSGGATIPPAEINLFNAHVTPLVSPTTLRWTVEDMAPNGLMCSNYDDVDIINSQPTTAFAGGDQSGVCGSTGLAANAPGTGETGLWQTVAGTGTFANASQNVTTVTNMQLGSNTYRWTITKGTCTSSDEVIITSDAIAANINTPNQNTCNTSIVLIADNSAPAVGQWTAMGSPATFSNSTNFSTTASGLQLGVNLFEWKVTYGACITYDYVTITNYTITQANAGADQSVCFQTANLNANTPVAASGETGFWSSPFVPGVTFVNSTSPATTANNLSIGSNTLRWTITNGVCSSSEDVIITVNAYTPDAGNDQNICTNTTTLFGSNQAPGTGTWSLISGSGSFATPNASSTIVTGITSVTNTYRWTVTQGLCIYSDDIVVNMNSPTTANAGPDQIVCSNSATLDADVPTIGTGKWTTGTAGVIFTNTADPKSGVSNLPPGGTTFRWTVTNNGCSSWDEVLISNNDFTTGAGVPQVLCTDNTMLDGINPGTGTGVWTVRSGSGTFVDPTYYRTQVINVGRGDNIYRWTVSNGFCSEFAEVRVSNYSVLANAGLDDYTCTGTYTLQGNNPATQSLLIPFLPATGTWTTPGSAILANANLFNTGVTNMNPDVNTFIWTVTNGVCTDVDEVTISNDMPTVPNAGNDDIFCGIDFAPSGYNSIYNSLHANAPNYGRGEVGVWTQVAGTSTFLDANTTLDLRVDELEFYAQLGGPDYWNLNPTVNTYRWTISYKLCSVFDEVTITNAAPDSALAGPDQIVCWDNADMNAVDLGRLAQLHWWVATPPDGITFFHPMTGVVDNNEFNAHVEGLQIGTTTFTWYKENTLSIPGKTVTCTIWDDMDVTRVAANVGATTAGTNQVVCSREAMMQGSPPGAAFTPPPVYNVTGQWSVLSGGASFDNASIYNTRAYDLDYDTNVLRWTLTNHDLGCIITNDVYITNALPSNANAGPDSSVCSSTALLSAERPTRGTGSWSVIGGGGTISNTSCQGAICNVIVTNMGTGLNSFLWTMANTYNDPSTGISKTCYLYDQVNIMNNMVIAEAGLDITTCTDDALLAATAPDVLKGQTGLWEVVGGSGVIANPTLYNSTISGLSPNINTLRWTLFSSGCSSSDFINITNNNPTDPVVSTPNATSCNGNGIINGNDPSPNGTGLWSVYSGGGTIANISLTSTTVSGMPIGSNTYRWTVTKNGCSEYADIIITNRAVTANAGSDINNVCGIEPSTSSVTLNATAPNIALGESGIWSRVTGIGTVVTPTAFNTLITGMGNGENRFRWRLTNGVCTSTDLVSVFVYIPTTANAGADYKTCASLTDSRPLTGNSPAVGRGSGLWSLISGGGTIANPSNAITTVINLAPDLNVFRWTINYNNCISTDEVTITNNYVTSNAGLDDLVCVDSYTLKANDPLVFYDGNALPSGQWTLRQGTGVFVSPTLYNTTVNGLSTAMTNIYRWTITKDNCSAFDEVQIVNNRFVIDAGINQTVCTNYAFLDAQQPGTGTGVWSVTSGGGSFTNASLYNTRVDGLSTDPNIYRWTVTRNGCSAYDEVTVYNNQVIANAGTTQRVCDNFATLDGNDPTLILPAGATGNWIATVGGASITMPSLRNTGVTNLATGQNTFQWTIQRTMNGVTCSNASVVNVFNDKPSDAVIEADNEVCDNFTELTVINIPTAGTGIWSRLDNVATFNNISSFNAIVTGLNRGVNTFRWTVTNQACSSFDDVLITNNAVIADAGVDKSTACANFTTLSGNNPLLTQGSGLWQDMTGTTASIINNTLYNTSITGLQQGTTEFQWTVSLGSCSKSDIVRITNNQLTATAGVDQVTCNDFYVPLDGNDVSGLGGTGVWTSVGNTAVVTTPSLFNTGVTGLDPGLNTFRWTITSGQENCTDFDEVTITNGKLIANAGTDFSTCNSTITLGAQDPAPATGYWTQASGNAAIIVNSTSPTTQVTGLTGGVYAFKWTVQNANCSNSATVVVTNNSPQPATAGTSAAAVCNGSGDLVGNVLLVGESGLWTPVSAGGTILNPTSNNTSVSGLSLGNNTFRWTITKGTIVSCSSYAEVTITNNQVISSAGSDQDICTSTATLQGNNPLNTQGSGVWTKIGVNPATITTATAYNTTVSNLADNTSHGFTWTVTQGTCSASDDVYIRNNRVLANAGSDAPTCDNFINLDGNDVSSIVGATGLWTKQPLSTASIATASQYNTSVTGLQPGINRFTWTVSTSGGCVSSDDVEITYNQVIANAGLDIETCNASIVLGAITPASGSGLWTQTGGNAATIVTPSNANTTVSGLTGGSYNFRWTVSLNGCSAFDEVVIVNSSPQTAIANTDAPEVCNGNGNLVGNVLLLGETGLWTPVSASGTIANPSVNSTTVSGLGLGANTFRWTIRKGTNVTCTSSAEVTIMNNQVISSAGSDQDICISTATLQGNNPLNTQGTGVWTKIGVNPSTITTATAYNTTVSNLADNTSHGFTWTVSQGTCSASDDVYIRNNRVLANAGSDMPTCDNFINLDGNDVSSIVGASGLWTKQPASTANIVVPSVYNTLITSLEPGINRFTWTVTSATGCVDSDDVEITYNYVAANAGLDRETCNSAFSLAAVPPSAGSGYWTQTGGSSVTIANSTNPSSGISGLTSGNYIFTWTVLIGACSATDDVVITNSAPQTAIAGTSTPEICGGTGTLIGNAPLFGENGIWTMVDATGTFDDQTYFNAQVSGLKSGTNTFRWTLSKGITVTCASSADVSIVNNAVTASAAVDNSISCDGTVRLTGNNPTIQSGTGLWTVSTGANIDNTSSYNTFANNLAQGLNTFTWTITKGSCSSSSNVNVTNNQVSATLVGNTISTCTGDVTLNAVNPAPNTGLWTIETADNIGAISIANATLYNTSVTGITGSATFRWTVNSSTCSDYKFVTVNNNSVNLTNGADQNVCAFNGTLNAGGTLSSGQTGVWSSAGTLPVISNPTLEITSVSNLAYGENVFFWTVTSSAGCTGQAQYKIINNSPTIPNAGSDQSTCNNFANLSGNTPTYGTGLWTQVGGTAAVIGNQSVSSTTVTGLSTGASTFRWTITNITPNQTCTLYDDVVITNNSFNVVTGIDKTVCADTSSLSVVLGSPGYWTLSSGSAIIANSTNPSTKVTNLGSGTNIFIWTVNNGTCIISDEMRITNNAPETPIVEPNKTVCSANNVSISANAPSLGTGMWIPQGGTATVSDPTNHNAFVSNLSNGTNTIRWVITNQGCSKYADMVITSYAVTASAGNDQALCSSSTSLNAIYPTVGTGSWTVTSSNGSPIIANSLAENSAVSNLGQGANILRWTVQNSGCSDFDEVTIINSSPTVANAGADIPTCNNTVNLNGNNPTVGSGKWSTLSSATIVNNTLSTTSVTVPSGTTVFTWTITNNGCTSSDDVSVINNSFTVNVNPDDVTCNGSYNLLGTNPTLVGTGTGTGTWTVIGGSGIFTNSMAYNTTVTNLLSSGSRESIFRWTVVDGACSSSSQVKITNDMVTASGNGFMTCNPSTSVVANDPGLQGATGYWTVDNQTTQAILQPTSFITTVSGLVPNAINRLRWTVSRNTCSASDTVNVEYFVPNANITIPDIAHGCADTVRLTADANLGGGTGLWSLKFGSLSVTIDNPSLNSTIARNLELGNNVFVWTVNARGCSSSDEVTVNNSKPVNTAGTDQSGCTNTFTMNAQTPSGTGSGVWSLISGKVTFASSTSPTTVVYADPGTNIIQWTITDNGCSSSKQFYVRNNLTSPNAGNDASVCENRVQLSGSNLKSGETGLWTIDGGALTEVFSNSSINNPEVSNLRQGTTTFVWTVTNGTCSADDRVIITNNTPFVDAGPDRTICEDFVTLVGNDPGTGTGVWSIGNANVQIATPSVNVTNVTNLSKGSNLFTWTVNNGLCTAKDFVLITSNSIDVVAGIPYTEDCADTLLLNGTEPPAGASGLWTAVEGGGIFANNTSYSTVVRNLSGFNKLRWTITTGTAPNQCSFYDEIDFVSLLPTKALTAADKPVCVNSTQITANAPAAGETGMWTKVIGSSAVTIVTPSSYQTMVNNLDPGVNTFKWTISNSQCSTSDLITVTNNSVFADAGQDKTICDVNYSLSANVLSGTGVWTANTLGVIIDYSTSPNTTVSNLNFGPNSFSWTVTYNGCSATDEVILTSNLPRNVSAGSDQNICSGSTNLAGSNPGLNGTGLWTLTGGAGTFDNPTSNQTVVSGLATGENIFRWTVTVGSCSASNQVRINNNSLYVTAGTDQVVCNTDTLQLDGTQPTGSITGTWTVNGGAGTFDNASVYNTVVRNMTKGINTYVWTLKDGSCSNSAFVTVINNTPDSAKVGPAQLICTDNTTINAIAVSNGTGRWSLKSGSATINNPTANNTTVSGINSGLNTFTWTVTKNGCSLAADVNVTNNAVNAYIANDRVVVCTPTHTATIIGNTVKTGETGTWSKISAGNGIITNSLSNVTTVTNLDYGNSFFRWTVTNNLCTNSDDIQVTNNYYNLTTASVAGSPTVCQDYVSILGSMWPDGASGKWTSTAPDVTFDSNSSVSTIARRLPSGTSTITWTITKDACASPASFNIVNNSIYTSAGADKVVCQTTTSLNALELLAGQTGQWTVNNGAVVIANTANPATTVSNLITGDNTFTWTISGNGCTASDDVTVSNNAFIVTAGNPEISCGPSYLLKASDPLTGTGIWTVNSGQGSFASATSFETTVSNMVNGPNTFTWTVNRNGCSASANVTITNDLYIAKVGDDRSVCSNQTTVSAQPISPTSGATGAWTALTGGGTFANPTLASTLVSGLSIGDNMLRWTVTKGTCVSFDEILITNNTIVTSAGTDETTCNNFASLSATPLSATATGLWTGGGVSTTIVSPTSPNTTVLNLQQGTNTFAWTVRDKGCTGTSTVRITSNYFVARAGYDQVVTADLANMTAELPNPAATGAWTVFSGNGTFADPTLRTTSVTGLGYGINTFRWTVDWNSCVAFDDVNITYNSVTAFAGNDTTICTSSITINASDPYPGTGVWTRISGGGVIANPASRTTVVSGILPGTVNIFRWTVTIGGYSVSDDITIVNKEFSLFAGVDKILCVDTVKMAADPAGVGTGFWKVLAGSGTISDISSHNSIITNLGEGPNLFVWTVSKTGGCTNSDTVQVFYNAPPIPAFTPVFTSGCSPITVTFTNESSGGTSYYWYLGDFQRTDTELTTLTRTFVAYDQDSTYNISLTAYDDAGCSATVTHQVTAYQIPRIEFSVAPNYPQLYPDATFYIFNNSGNTYPNYEWDFGDGTTDVQTSFVSSFPHTYATWGKFYIRLTVSSTNCSSTAIDSAIVLAPIPTNNGGRDFEGCEPYAVNFRAATLYADRYLWEFGDGGTSTLEDPIYIYDTPGRYIVKLYAWGPGSPVDSVLIRRDTVDVYPRPHADFIVEPDTVMLPSQPIHCYNRSTHGDYFTWDFGLGSQSFSTEENPVYYYTQAGTYYITLGVRTEQGCFDDTTGVVGVVVQPPGVCRFPNAFTPNPFGSNGGVWYEGDVTNDVFHPIHRGVKEFKLEIFNRWGEKVFESNDVGIGWDGYVDGKLAAQDVYVWKVTGKYNNGVIFKDAGDVTLIR